jgi:integrase/recombinase XerD
VEAHIRSFLNYLRVEKGLSANTIEAYHRDLLKFAAFAAQHGLKTEKVKRADVVDFLSGLYRHGLDSRSVARHLVAVRTFFRFSLTEGLIKEDPAANVESPKFRQSLPDFLTVEEVDRLLAQPDVATTIGLRDKAMIELLYSAGLRVSELCSLGAEDVHVQAGCLRCIGKGNKERLVPVGRRALEVVQEYMKKARPEMLGERTSEFLFVNRRCHRIDRISFWKTAGGLRTQSGAAQKFEAAHAAA